MIKKHIFKNDKQREHYLIEAILIHLEKCCDHGFSPRSSFEKDCLKHRWVALSMLERNLFRSVKGEKFQNALSNLPDNADYKDRFMDLLFRMEKQKYFKIGGAFDKKYYFYKINPSFQIK